MALKSIISSEEFNGLDDNLQGFYVQDGDGFVLDTDSKDKIKEFRNNNIKYLKDLESAKSELSKYSGVDIEELKKAQKELQDLQEKSLMDEGKIEELIAQRTERMRNDFSNQVEIAKKSMEDALSKASRFESELSELKINQMILDEIHKVARPKKGALPDIMARARTTWKLDDSGNPIPMHNGQVVYGADASPLKPSDYVRNLVKDASHLFEESKGSGSSGSTYSVQGNAGGVLRNPSLLDFGKNLEEIAKGKITVNRD